MRAPRTTLPLLLAVIAAITAITASPASGQAVDPAVSVAAGPTTSEFFVPECNDVALTVATSDALVFTRTGDTTSALTVSYSVGGTAEPGVDYAPLPGSITFVANSSTAEAPLDVLESDDRSHTATVAATVTSGTGYTVGDPATASATILVERDDDLGPVECGIAFAEAVNDEIVRTVAVGSPLAPLVVVEDIPPGGSALGPDDVLVELVDGTLPPGVTLRDDGTFAGAPTTAGAYEAIVLACRSEDDEVCAVAELRITVTAAVTTSSSSSSTIPVTGASSRSTGLLGGAVLAIGLIALGTSLRRREA